MIESNHMLLFVDFEIPYLLKDADYAVGGSCIRLYALAKGLSELGQKVGFLTWKGAREYIGGEPEFELVETYSLRGGIRRLRWLYDRFPSLISKVRINNPDFLFHKSSGSHVGIFAFICSWLKVPFVYLAANDIDADERYKDKLNRLEQVLYRYGLKNSKAIFSQNNYQYERFQARFPRKAVYKVSNPYYYDNLPILLDREQREYIAWVGIFQQQKNLPSLLRIAQANKDHDFRVVGKGGRTLDEESRQALEELRKCPNVKMEGYLNRDQVVPFLSKAYALLNTSHFEGFSNTYLEAFAAGTPVVTMQINPDNILKRYKLGFLGGEKDMKDIFHNLQYEYNYTEEAKRLRAYLIDKHDYRVIAQKFLDCLKKGLN